MPSFAKHSEDKLNTCDKRLQTILRTVIQFYDFTIIWGGRNETQQNKLYDDGKSKLKYPNSKHNTVPSLAVDVAPYPIDWNDLPRFYVLMGRIKQVADMLDIPIRGGDDWDDDDITKDNKFNDLGHVEIMEPNITTNISHKENES